MKDIQEFVSDRFVKSFLFIEVVIILFLVSAGIWSYSNGGTIDFLVPMIFTSIIILIIIEIWIYAFFLLVDSREWYFVIFGILMTGLVGAGILLILRNLYRKYNWHFLD